LLTNRKSHTLLVPKSVTFNDLEQRNGRYWCALVSGPNYVKVVGVRPIGLLPATKM